MDKKISIVVPVYNAEKYIARCIESLIGQSYPNIEVVLVNDSSTDNSAEVCQRYAKKDSRVKFFTKENEGAGIARNYGIQKSSGQLLGFCDADDYVASDMYEKLIKELEDKDCDIAYCLHVDDPNTPKISGNIELFEEDDIWSMMVGEVGTRPEEKLEVLYGSAVWRGLYKKSIVIDNSISFMSERVIGSEDLIFNLEYLKFCKRAVYVMDELYHHCPNYESMTHSKKHFEIEHEIRLYDKIDDVLGTANKGEYQLELDRFLIKRIRASLVCISKGCDKGNIKESLSELKEVLDNDHLRTVLKRYPGYKLPIKRALYFYCMKYRLVRLVLLLGQKG